MFKMNKSYVYVDTQRLLDGILKLKYITKETLQMEMKFRSTAINAYVKE